MSKRFDISPNTLYFNPIKCNGCGVEYCILVREDEDNEDTKYCGCCFGHVVGLKEFESVIKEMDLLTQVIWQTPNAELSNEVKRKIVFVDKKRNVLNDTPVESKKK